MKGVGMGWSSPNARVWLAVVLGGLGVVAYLDYRFAAILPASHLYYLPILLAAVSFGWVGGLLAAASAIALFHLTHFVATGTPARLDEADLLRFALFLVVGLVTARLVDHSKHITHLAQEIEARNAELARANDRLTRLSQARADFVAVASHEVRTPLTTILGSADMLARLLSNPEPPDQERLVRLATRLRDSARMLQRTVDNLLDATLIESGRLNVRREKVGLAELLAEAAQTFAGTGTERLVLPEPAPELVLQGDRDRLAQVLTNLVGNALKYSPFGSPVRVDVEEQSGRVLVSVSDHGYGISPEELPRVFERYYRADDGRVRAARGAGLGLSISRDIVRAHGGELTVESRLGEGSTFTMALPVQTEEDSDAEARDRYEAAQAGPELTHRYR